MINLNEGTPQDAKDALEIIIHDKNKDGLWFWIRDFLGAEIPRRKCCQNHDAPFDFVADYVFGLYDFMIVLANRSGGKTMNFGILDTTISWLLDNTEVATVGAIQSQAQKCYEYFRAYSQKFPFDHNISRRTMKKTDLLNGSQVQVLTGTMSGVNSPHPQLVFLDEIDLMNWPVMQQALSMAQSKNDVRARTVLTSTRKFAGGVMQRMMDEAASRGAKLYQWCIWEVVKPLPKDPEKLAEIHKVFGDSLPMGLEDAEGYYEWDDLITKYQTLDREVWETEWLCSRPGLEGVIYGSSYSDDNNLISTFDINKNPGYVYLAEDFGSVKDHPDVVLFCWVPVQFNKIVVFDELYMTDMGDEEIWQAVDEKLQKYGHRLPNRALNIQGTVRGWAADFHGIAEIRNRQLKGAPMMDKAVEAQLYIVENGITIIRKFLQAGRLMITTECPNLRLEFLSYKRQKNMDGTFKKDPEKRMDHGPDALRYLLVVLFSTLGIKAFEPSRPTKKVEDPPESLYQGVVRPKQDRSEGKPYSARLKDIY